LELRKREARETGDDYRAFRIKYGQKLKECAVEIATKAKTQGDRREIERQFAVALKDDLSSLKAGLGIARRNILLSKELLTAVADLLRPPAQHGHPVLERAYGNSFRLPARDQRLDVLGLEAVGPHVPETHFVQLVGDQRQDALARILGGVAAVAVSLAELLQFVVQVSHRSFSIFPFRYLFPFGVAVAFMVCAACPVSVCIRPAGLSAAGTQRDSGHHSRVVPFLFLLATAARGIGVEVAPLRERSVEMSQRSRLGGAPLRRDWDCPRERALGQTALHGRLRMMAAESPITRSRHLRQEGATL